MQHHQIQRQKPMFQLSEYANEYQYSSTAFADCRSASSAANATLEFTAKSVATAATAKSKPDFKCSAAYKYIDTAKRTLWSAAVAYWAKYGANQSSACTDFATTATTI